jgi:hypothetical protein
MRGKLTHDLSVGGIAYAIGRAYSRNNLELLPIRIISSLSAVRRLDINTPPQLAPFLPIAQRRQRHAPRIEPAERVALPVVESQRFVCLRLGWNRRREELRLPLRAFGSRVGARWCCGFGQESDVVLCETDKLVCQLNRLPLLLTEGRSADLLQAYLS